MIWSTYIGGTILHRLNNGNVYVTGSAAIPTTNNAAFQTL